MNASLRPLPRPDVQCLIRAIAASDEHDRFAPTLTPAQWEIFSNYLQPLAVENRQVVIEQNATDRTLYLVESGSLTVHYEDTKGRLRLAVVGPGSAVGEGAFFSRQPRSATVQAAQPSKVWSLPPLRFSELSKRQPEIAVEVVMALGSLVSRRLVNKPKRVAVT